MNKEANKQTVRLWFEAVNRGDEAAILALLTEDFIFQSMARAPEWIRYRWDRNRFAAAPATMSALMTGPVRMEIVSMIAEDDRVAVEAATNSLMKSGKTYDNAYHLAFVLRDGLIARVHEYSCSYLVQDCFAALNPG